MSKQEEIVGKPISDAIGGEMADEKEVPKRLSRKDFVKGAAVVAGAGALASCAPAATPVPEAVPTCPPAEECPPCPTPAAAGEAGPVTFEVFNPSGASEITKLFAKRLDTLEGKTICLIGASWGGDMSLPVTYELLKEQYPTANVIPYTEMPSSTDLEGIQKALTEKGCDAVIQGNAG